MKKLILICAILFALAIYGSLQAINYISSPEICADCHAGSKYSSPVNGSILPFHVNSSITCIDCHSQGGVRRLEALETVASAKLTKDMKPTINMLFQANFSSENSFNATLFAKMRANCEKCHPNNDLKGEVHTNNVSCGLCHFVHTKPKINSDAARLLATGIKTHKTLKCSACHGTGTDIQIPSCTKCHEPHEKGAKWDNSVCLGCHNDAHVPTRKITLNENIPKEWCGGCHESEYQNLTSNGGKHNQFVSCASCHPAHGSKKSCWDCHGGVETHIPHMPNDCWNCHSRVNIRCEGCHDPHNPYSGLPNPGTDEQIGMIAKERFPNGKVL